MKIVLILSILLFFEICTGLPLQKNQLQKSPTKNLTDVYEIEEGDKKTIRFVYPKSEKPTLREITYFHVKEAPYPEDDEFETKHLTVTGETGKVTGEGALDSGEDLLPEEEYGDALEELEVEEEPTTKTIHAKETTTGAPSSITTEVINTLTDSEKPVQEKISARNLLFSQAKGKYQLRKQEKSTQKHKREISLKDLPPAPTLAPLDLSILPEDVKRMLSSAPEPGSTTPKQKQPHLTEDEFKKLDHLIQNMTSSLSPKRDEDVNKDDDDNDEDDDDDDDDENDDADDNDENEDYWDDDDTELVDKIEENDAKVRKPRTYGMNLKNGRGYVWNDLLSEPGIPGVSFEVGKQDDSSEKKEIDASEHKKPESTEKPTAVEHTTQPMITASYPTESRPIYMSSDNNESYKKEDSIKPNEESSDNKDLEDIEVSAHKARLLPNEDNSSEKEDDKKEKLDNDDVKLKSNAPHEETTEIKKEHNKQHKKKHENKIVKIPENNDLFKELMKNEQFWKWLSEWTATYLELLMKHVKDVVEDEVASQMKTLAAKLKKELTELISNNNPKHIENIMKNTEKSEDNTLIIDGKEIPITHTTNFDSVGEKKLLDNKPKENHNKEHNSNVTKHKEHNEKRKENVTANIPHKDSNKHRMPTSIRAQNIFGNTVGSDKVTNIFVFYPEDDESKDDIKENIKPLMNGSNNVFTFGSDDKVDIDKRHPEIIGHRDESTMTDKEPQNVPAIKPVIDNSQSTESSSKIKESEKENKENGLHAESATTTTPKNDADNPKNATDKKEIDSTSSAKVDDSTQDNPLAAENKSQKNSSESNKEAALDIKEKEDQKAEDSIKTEEIKANDKKDEDASESSNKAETTTGSPSDSEKDSGNEDKKPENQDIAPTEETITEKVDDKMKDLEKETNKELNKENERKKDSEKKEDSVILQA